MVKFVGKLANLFNEDNLNKAEVILKLKKSSGFNPGDYKQQLLTLLNQHNELILEVEEWFNDPEFGKKPSNWKRILNLRVEEETKKELKKLYDKIISELKSEEEILFYKIHVPFNSDKIDTREFLKYFNSNSCIRDRRFELKRVYPVLVTNTNFEVVGRSLCFEANNVRIIFNLYIQHTTQFTGFSEVLKNFNANGYNIIYKKKYRDWLNNFYLDDFVIIGTIDMEKFETYEKFEEFIEEEFLEGFYSELEGYVFDNTIGECYNCGNVIRDGDDDYCVTEEGDYYCSQCIDSLVYCDRCGGYHDPEYVEVVRVEVDRRYYYSCEFEILR